MSPGLSVMVGAPSISILASPSRTTIASRAGQRSNDRSRVLVEPGHACLRGIDVAEHARLAADFWISLPPALGRTHNEYARPSSTDPPLL
jgi:hypothetical protein